MKKSEAQKLANALKKQFRAEVEIESVDGNGRFRFAVVSQQFESMNQLERQDRVWEVVDRVMPRAATLDISLILAFAPKELAGSGV